MVYCYSSLKTCCCVLCIPYCFADQYEPLNCTFLWNHRDQICSKLNVQFFEKPCLGVGQWEMWETDSYREGRYLGGGADILLCCLCGICHLFPATWSWSDEDFPIATNTSAVPSDQQPYRLEN